MSGTKQIWEKRYDSIKLGTDQLKCFYADITEGDNYNFSQLIIENQQKCHYLMSRSTPGTLSLRTPSAPGTLYLHVQNTQGTQIKLCEFLSTP